MAGHCHAPYLQIRCKLESPKIVCRQMKNSIPQESFRNFLQEEFISRCRKNPKYSIRTFAKTLNTDAGSLSQILRDKRKVTKRIILKFSEQLNLGSEKVEKFLKNVAGSSAITKEYEQLSIDAFKTIAEWFHAAIFELITVTGFDPSPEKVGRQLGITTQQAAEAIERLLRIKLIEKDRRGRLSPTNNYVTTTKLQFTDHALRVLQKGLMERSLDALEKVPFELRDHTAMTMAINSKRIAEAKRRITKFRRSLCEDLQVESRRDSVYQLLISFFPLTLPHGDKSS